MKRLAVVCVLVVMLVSAGTALAAAVTGTRGIGENAILAPTGKRVTLEMTVGCSESTRALVEVTVTQRGRSGIAEASTEVRCPEGGNEFKLVARSDDPLARGRAKACALAAVDGDAVQWCKRIRLKPG